MSQYLHQSANLTPNHIISSHHTINTIHIKPLKPAHKSIPTPSMTHTKTTPPPQLTNSSPTPNTNTNSNNASKPFTNNANNNNINNNNNQLKVQTEFMDAMTNAIIRYLDKNPDSSKSEAEISVFMRLGYDKTIEMSNDSMEEKINHFRRHHIMRNRDAIRTFRIKQIHSNIITQYPNYTRMDILGYLISKLNVLYLPSPSPPPPPKQVISKQVISIENNMVKKECKINENESINKPIIKVKNISRNNMNNKILQIPKYYNNKIHKKTINYKKKNNNNTNIINIGNKSVINYNNKYYKSSSQVYTHSNKNRLLKYKKRDKCIRKKRDKKPLINRDIVSSTQTTTKPSTNTSIYPSFIYYNDQEIISQKIALHKASRKRKLNINTFDTFDGSFDTYNNEYNEFDDFEHFDNKPPPKKRSRIDKFQHHTHDITDINSTHQSDCDQTLDNTLDNTTS